MLRSHVHDYSICVYERLIILMFLCQFMMLLKADRDLGQPVFPAFCVLLSQSCCPLLCNLF